MKTGTTCVGLVTVDGVVLATDMRASAEGRFVVNKNIQKVNQVHPTAAMTLAGTVGGAQWFTRAVRAEASLYQLRNGEPVDVESLQTMAGTVIRKTEMGSIHPLLGGVDDSGPHLASIDPAGGVIGEEFMATGSGMQLAYGHLEDVYEPGLSNEEAVGIAARSVKAASNRDTASGNGVSIAEVTDEGVDIHSHDDIDELL